MPDPHAAAPAHRPRPGSDAAVLAEINDIARQVLEDRGIALAADMVIDQLEGCDSMRQVGILVAAECRFDVAFAPEELEQIATVGDLVRLIQHKHAVHRRRVM